MSLHDDLQSGMENAHDHLIEAQREAERQHERRFGTTGVDDKLRELLRTIGKSDRFNRVIQYAILIVAALTFLAALAQLLISLKTGSPVESPK